MSYSFDSNHALRNAFEAQAQDLGLYTHGFQRHTQESAAAENASSGHRQQVAEGDYVSLFMQDAWKIYREFHTGLVAKTEQPKPVSRYDGGMTLGGQSVVKASDFDQERNLRLAAEHELESLRASYQAVHDALTRVRSERTRAETEVSNLQADLEGARRHSGILEIGVKNFDRLINLQKKQAAMALKALVASQGVITLCLERGSIDLQDVARVELILEASKEASALLEAANCLEVESIGVSPTA